jgi:cell division protein FtsB
LTIAYQAASARPRPLRSLLSAVIAFLLLVLATAALAGWRELEGARERERELAREVVAREERIRALERRIERLRDDPVTLDRLAREDLGMVSPGDVVLVLPERPAAAP